MRCANCERTLGGDSFKTAYGDYLCEDCWEEYLNTDFGRLEYFIALCNGYFYIGDFDADFLYEVAMSWKIHRDKLNFTQQQLQEFERKACELGLL